MATFGGLFDFPDLLDGQSELSSPPDSSNDEHSNEHTEDKDDASIICPPIQKTKTKTKTKTMIQAH
jgi:hypothetical protein